MKNFSIISNPQIDGDNVLAEKISSYITGLGCRCTIVRGGPAEAGGGDLTDGDRMIPDDTECVITIGGDGTMIAAAKDLMERDAVLIGINCGRLGYLAEINRDEFEPAIDLLADDAFKTEERMMLEGSVVRDGRTEVENAALNDIVIHRGAGSGLITFDIYVNGMYLSRYSADGVLFCTPTGSTAYNLSAGGPIVKPDARLILLNPICAHTINGRCIVLSGDDVITAKICPDRFKNAVLAFDGNGTFNLESGDEIIVKRREGTVRIAKIKDNSFIEILKEKMSDR